MKPRSWFSIGSLLLAAPLAACSAEDADPVCDTSAVGTLCTIAGNGENGYDKNADEEVLDALHARLSLPQDILTVPDGTLYIIDWNNHRIRSLGADGKLRHVAGRGELGGTLDDHENNDFNHPTNLVFDPSSNSVLIAAWHNSKIRRLSLDSGEITDSCGDGKRAYFGDEGPAEKASLDLPSSIAFDAEGRLVIMDQANQVLRRVNADHTLSRIAGQCLIDAPAPTGPGPCPDDTEPVRCPDGPNGPSGKWTCGHPKFCSLPCTPGYSGDDIPATELRMSQPFGQSATPAGRIAFDSHGDLYFADTANHLIRKIDEDGIVRRVAGLPPEDGVPQHGYSGDGGQATEALLNYPVDLAFSDDDTLYFTDVYNHCVRAIDKDGIISTVAGRCGQRGSGGDGGPATEAELKLPYGIEWVDGRLHIADTGNMRIRSVLLR